ncbi:hypothetical protein [Paenibacillus silviterrae]|jgi:hypothetical protein|uniref:hypothetical protein n=1 Tax=Paenibacillus silviterrae TaxID=3242194 RepID=UPI0025436457|nr:hypothetical protein [Paenibacillus chinjuensis]
MGKGSWMKMLLLAIGLAFCVFFGVDMATKGTERIQGSTVSAASGSGGKSPAAAEAKAYSAAPAAGAKAAAPAKTAGSPPAAASKPQERTELEVDTGVNRIGNKTGDLLQIMAYNGIRAFIKLFEAVLS